jgi:hypothetical protein
MKNSVVKSIYFCLFYEALQYLYSISYSGRIIDKLETI